MESESGETMELYLVRHGDAAPLGEGGVTEDENRPLTAKGQDQAKHLAAVLPKKATRPAVLVSSPLLRARQTAEAMQQNLGEPGVQVRICDDLAPGGKRRKVAKYLKDLSNDPIALVGHEPDLGQLAGWFVGSKNAQICFSKSGIACIRFEERPDKDEGTLIWLITPGWMD
jgi:phosphohistidine phosphatase